jgi:tetratricopeptide (TPR) repeat protein
MEVIQTLLHQIEQARERGDRPLEAESLSTLGNFYFDDGRWDEALQVYEQSLELFRDMEDPIRLAGAQVRLADVYMARKEWEQALALCEAARDTMEQAGDEAGLARTYTNLGILYWQTGDWRQALTCYHKRLEIVERLGDLYEIGNVSANLGMLCQVFADHENAARHLARAYLIARSEGFELLEERSGAQLADVCGSREAANAYLAQLTGDDSVVISAESGEEGMALDTLLEAMSEALTGDHELALQLTQYTAELAGDEAQPAPSRELSRILGLVLAGDRSPDLGALPPEIAGRLEEWLKTLPA